MPKAKKPSYYKNKADELFSKIIRSKGRCLNCGASDFLQCAHVISRRFSNTRCDLRNAVCLCARCHIHFTNHPVEWGHWVDEHIPDYPELYKLSQQTTKVNWEETLERLKREVS